MEALLISATATCSILLIVVSIRNHLTAKKAKKAAEQKKFLEERDKRYKENVALGMPTVGPLPRHQRGGIHRDVRSRISTPPVQKIQDEEPYIPTAPAFTPYPSDPIDSIISTSIIQSSDEDTTRYNRHDDSWNYGGGGFGGSGAGGSYDSDSSNRRRVMIQAPMIRVLMTPAVAIVHHHLTTGNT